MKGVDIWRDVMNLTESVGQGVRSQNPGVRMKGLYLIPIESGHAEVTGLKKTDISFL